MTFEYDDQNRLIKTQEIEGGDIITNIFTYGANGDLTQIKESSELEEDDFDIISFRYVKDTVFVVDDSAPLDTDTLIINDKKQAVKKLNGNLETYTYNANGTLATSVYKSYTFSTTTNYTYDEGNNSIWGKINMPSWFFIQSELDYSLINNILKIKTTSLDSSSYTYSYSYTYNSDKYPSSVTITEPDNDVNNYTFKYIPSK